MITTKNLLEDVKKCLEDPVYNLVCNFSLEKSRLYYDKWEKAWDNWCYDNNPAVKKEKEVLPFTSLDQLSTLAEEAHNLFRALWKLDYIDGPDWYVWGQNIVITRNRLKTFEEWLEDWLRDALKWAYEEPEDWARMLLERTLWDWIYSNTAIHLFAEWKIDVELLKRLWTPDKCNKIEGRNYDEDIKQARLAIEDIEASNTIANLRNEMSKSVTVLKLKK